MIVRVRAVLTVVLAAVCVFSAGQASAQVSEGQTLQAAQAKVGAQDFEGALEILRVVREREPENPRVWMMTGNAHMALSHPAMAREAFVRATEFAATSGLATFQVGITYAAEDRADDAFEWLLKAKKTGAVNVTNIGLNPHGQKLQSDVRWASLFPTEAELADPFVEETRIIHEWSGEAAGDVFGWIARNIGDLDGDAVNDVVSSAPSWGADGFLGGKVYAYSGRSGDLLWAVEGNAGDRLGVGVESAGDVNADGVPDVVASGPAAGRALVLSGRDGAVLHEFSGGTSDNFGGAVAEAGDMNEDGYNDVLVGASGVDQGRGAAYVFSGRDGSTLLELSGPEAGQGFGSAVDGWSRDGKGFLVIGAPNGGEGGRGQTFVYRGLTSEPAFVIEADETGAQLGAMFVSVVGDLDADGVQDIYAADWANAAKGPGTGRIFIHSGATGERMLTLTGEAPGDGFGIGIADAGDVDDDGHDDLIIGAWQHASAAPSGGKVYLYSGRDGSLVYTVTSRVPGETFGFDATGMGDVDGDGIDDLLLTSAWASVGAGARRGRTFLLAGKK